MLLIVHSGLGFGEPAVLYTFFVTSNVTYSHAVAGNLHVESRTSLYLESGAYVTTDSTCTPKNPGLPPFSLFASCSISWVKAEFIRRRRVFFLHQPVWGKWYSFTLSWPAVKMASSEEGRQPALAHSVCLSPWLWPGLLADLSTPMATLLQLSIYASGWRGFLKAIGIFTNICIIVCMHIHICLP